jgi:hypothetical protein
MKPIVLATDARFAPSHDPGLADHDTTIAILEDHILLAGTLLAKHYYYVAKEKLGHISK